MNKDELRIRIIPEDGEILIETHRDGIVKCKAVQEDAFLDCIKNSAMQDYVNSGLLPPDCIHVKVHPNGNKAYCLLYPRLYADIRYHETDYPDFPLPRLVFAFQVDMKGKISKCRLGVVADERPTMETVMYHYPFSNVSGEDGDICIGANALPKYKTPHTLMNLPTFLLSIPNNDHSYSPLNSKLRMQYRDLLEHLKDKDPSYYYSDVLIPNGKTLKDFIGG